MLEVSTIETHMTKSHPDVEFRAYETQEQMDVEDDATEAVTRECQEDGFAKMNARMDEMMAIMRELVIEMRSDRNSSVGASPFRTPMRASNAPLSGEKAVLPKNATLEFAGVVPNLHPHGKFTLSYNNVPTVVYKRGKNLVYYSPVRATGVLAERMCSPAQIQKIEDMTEEDMHCLGCNN